MEQKSAKKTYIIHGWEANPNCNWFPWLKEELTKRNIKAIVPIMPNTNTPDCTEWVKHLKQIIKNPDKNTYLVGHSLGVIAILRFLELIPMNNKIGGIILVAGFSEPIGFKVLNSFFQTTLNYEKIKKSVKMIIVINSDNDPYVPIENGYLLRDKLEAKLIIIPNAGHLNEGDGFFRLPIVLDYLLK